MRTYPQPNLNRIEMHPLWSGPGFQVFSSRWERARHPADSEAQVSAASVEFMRQGSYLKQTRGATIVGDPNHAVFFNPGESFRVRHPHVEANAGTTIRVSHAVLEELLCDLDPAATETPARVFRFTHAPTTPHCHLLQQELISSLAAPAWEPVLVEELVLHVLRAALRCAYHGSEAAIPSVEAVFDPLNRARVFAVQDYLNAAYAERLTLAEIARVADCSLWHISRVFVSFIGLSIHRYLKRLRLRHALVRLADGCRNLTHLALETGFNSHSHFTAAFRQEFGATPGELRRRLAVAPDPGDRPAP